MRERLLVEWANKLTGLEPDRIVAAKAEIATWATTHPARALLDETIDAAVAATLLVEGVEQLVSRGAPREQIHRKLRQDPHVWSAWAEVRAADLILRAMAPETEIRLEVGRSRGAQADFRFVGTDPAHGTTIEFKAVGLSDDEVAFCRRMRNALAGMLPPEGIVHVHAPLDAAPPRFTTEQRRATNKQAALRR